MMADLEVRREKEGDWPGSEVKRDGLGYGSVMECLPSTC